MATIKIPFKLKRPSPTVPVTTAQDVMDSQMNKWQSEINSELKTAVNNLTSQPNSSSAQAKTTKSTKFEVIVHKAVPLHPQIGLTYYSPDGLWFKTGLFQTTQLATNNVISINQSIRSSYGLTNSDYAIGSDCCFTRTVQHNVNGNVEYWLYQVVKFDNTKTLLTITKDILNEDGTINFVKAWSACKNPDMPNYDVVGGNFKVIKGKVLCTRDILSQVALEDTEIKYIPTSDLDKETLGCETLSESQIKSMGIKFIARGKRIKPIIGGQAGRFVTLMTARLRRHYGVSSSVSVKSRKNKNTTIDRTIIYPWKVASIHAKDHSRVLYTKKYRNHLETYCRNYLSSVRATHGPSIKENDIKLKHLKTGRCWKNTTGAIVYATVIKKHKAYYNPNSYVKINSIGFVVED